MHKPIDEFLGDGVLSNCVGEYRIRKSGHARFGKKIGGWIRSETGNTVDYVVIADGKKDSGNWPFPTPATKSRFLAKQE